jgi:geranylgeranyl diphosphate synthase type II
LSKSAKHDSGSFSAVDDRLAEAHAFVEDWLARVLPPRDAPPRRLHCAMHEAVFPAGRRTLPMLCRLVADVHGGGDSELVGRFAAALELVHCASRVQDDLQSHAAHGQATAILIGDALLTLAFETLANAPAQETIAFRLMGLLASATGGSHGVICAQAMELERSPDEDVPRRLATVALLRAAAIGGAIISGADGETAHWARVGELVGEAVRSGDRTRIGKAAVTRAALRGLLGASTLESEAIQRLFEDATR